MRGSTVGEHQERRRWNKNWSRAGQRIILRVLECYEGCCCPSAPVVCLRLLTSFGSARLISFSFSGVLSFSSPELLTSLCSLLLFGFSWVLVSLFLGFISYPPLSAHHPNGFLSWPLLTLDCSGPTIHSVEPHALMVVRLSSLPLSVS